MSYGACTFETYNESAIYASPPPSNYPRRQDDLYSSYHDDEWNEETPLVGARSQWMAPPSPKSVKSFQEAAEYTRKLFRDAVSYVSPRARKVPTDRVMVSIIYNTDNKRSSTLRVKVDTTNLD